MYKVISIHRQYIHDIYIYMFMHNPQIQNLVHMKFLLHQGVFLVANLVTQLTRSSLGTAVESLTSLISKVQKERAATIPKLKGPLFQVHRCTAMLHMY